MRGSRKCQPRLLEPWHDNRSAVRNSREDGSVAKTVINSEFVRLANEAYANLQLPPARIEELPIELEQLSRAIEAVNAKVDFDIDPSDFRAALLAIAGEQHD
jgi:hypothetical protein